jgi:hypothetical protein
MHITTTAGYRYACAGSISNKRDAIERDTDLGGRNVVWQRDTDVLDAPAASVFVTV